MKKYVVYYRVSTKKQEKSQLGLGAQKKIVSDYIAANSGRVVATYTEIETGKNSDRPQLKKALAHAKLQKATLVVAKLDRLARNMAFTSTLMDSGTDFVACDNPYATRFLMHVLAAVAEQEAVSVSRRTKDALAVAKTKGVLLGSARPGHWEGRENKRGWKKGAKNSAIRRSQRAVSVYAFLVPTMQDMQNNGFTLLEIATKLNDDGHLTSVGKPFTPTAVLRVLKRAEESSEKVG